MAGSIAGYRTLRLLGEGGMARVWLAEEAETGRRVALKVLSEGARDPEARRRFEREARLAREAAHECLVPLVAEGLGHDPPWLAYRWMERGHLGALRGAEAASLVAAGARVAAALAHLHGRGIVHRDVKPENVLLDSEGKAWLADLGLGRAEGRDATLTQEGMAMGTPGFLAPEVLDGEEAGAAADVFALGAMLGELLTGVAADRREELERALGGTGAPELAGWVRRCLRTDPRDRPAAVAVAAALEALEEVGAGTGSAAIGREPAATPACRPGDAVDRKGLPGAVAALSLVSLGALVGWGLAGPAMVPAPSPGGALEARETGLGTGAGTGWRARVRGVDEDPGVRLTAPGGSPGLVVVTGGRAVTGVGLAPAEGGVLLRIGLSAPTEAGEVLVLGVDDQGRVRSRRFEPPALPSP